jgi:translation initiation factor IF-3
LKEKNGTGPLINEKIRFDKMQVISHDGKNLGLLSRDEALKLARLAELDLVTIAERGGEGHPVVKIMDFGKVLYAKKKQLAEAKKNQKVIQVKEIKLRPKIGEHDYRTKINQAIQFLKDGKHLKVTLMFKGRETTSKEERGEDLFDKIAKSFEEAGLTKLVQEKDSKSGAGTSQFWSRIYYLKK